MSSKIYLFLNIFNHYKNTLVEQGDFVMKALGECGTVDGMIIILPFCKNTAREACVLLYNLNEARR